MKVRVLYFAGAREAVGQGEEEVDLPAEVVTVHDFAGYVGRMHPALELRMSSIRIARNERFAEPEERLDAGDVLAVIPPVAGG